MLKVTGYDFSAVFELCRQVEDTYQDTCYQSLGRDASGSSVSDIEQTRQYCLLGQDDRQQINCVIGALKDFISYYHSDEQAKDLCSSLPANLQEECFSEVGAYYKSF